MSGITLLIEDPKWRSHRGLTARLTKAAQAARRSARLKGACALITSPNTQYTFSAYVVCAGAT